MEYGPFSTNSPNNEEPPGPPCNHSNTGAFAGSFCKMHAKIKLTFLKTSIKIPIKQKISH